MKVKDVEWLRQSLTSNFIDRYNRITQFFWDILFFKRIKKSKKLI